MAPRPPRTPAQTLADLELCRRLAALDRNACEDRLWALDRSIEALRSGATIPACALELALEGRDEAAAS